jgi:hypothetical protein
VSGDDVQFLRHGFTCQKELGARLRRRHRGRRILAGSRRGETGDGRSGQGAACVSRPTPLVSLVDGPGLAAHTCFRCAAANIMTSEHQPSAARARLHEARMRLSRSLERSKRGPIRELPDDTLDLVASCLNEIADLVERRRALDSGERDQPACSAQQTQFRKI